MAQEEGASADAAEALDGDVSNSGIRRTGIAGIELSRRQMMAGSVVGAAVTAVPIGLLAGPSTANAAPAATAATPGVVYAAGATIGDNNRLALRALWDALVPGFWNGTAEDGNAPGADQAFVQAWLEDLASSTPRPIAWLTAELLNVWGADLNTWARLSTLFLRKYSDLRLGTSIVPPTRQGKVLLMMKDLVPLVSTVTDLQYFAASLLAKLAFYGDFWHEVHDPTTRVGRAYCGQPLPPGTSAIPNFSYGTAFSGGNPHLVTINGLVQVP